ncbi:hypothetical protein CLAVI_000781 [Candidatus Clavichlamydia salmonicola]|nr:hypothetical protein [Candidatus Clavichlamydia salmonicola]
MQKRINVKRLTPNYESNKRSFQKPFLFLAEKTNYLCMRLLRCLVSKNSVYQSFFSLKFIFILTQGIILIKLTFSRFKKSFLMFFFKGMIVIHYFIPCKT